MCFGGSGISGKLLGVFMFFVCFIIKGFKIVWIIFKVCIKFLDLNGIVMNVC